MNKYPYRIPITQPSITDVEIRSVNQAIRHGWGKNAYSYISKFETEFANYIGVKYAMTTSSCTGALHLAMLSLGIKSGMEVIVPDITWAATVFPISYVGAKPIFVDIDKNTWCLDPAQIEKQINSKTKAIIPVHLYGHPADMDAINKIARRYNLYVIEDAAESIGAEYKGHKTGSLADIAVFSFHGTKTLTTGEGGMFLTNNRKIYERAKFLNNLAKSPDKIFWNLEIGYKYLMSDIQASLGLAQLSRIKTLLTKKKQIFNWYYRRLKNIPGVYLNFQAKNNINSYWMINVVIDKKYKINKQQLMQKLDSYNITPRPFFYPLSSLPPYKTKVNNPVSYDLSSRAVNLPCGYNITQKEVNYICDILIKIINS